ncbi:hypothetical protein J6590_021151 [Homalodisca vitripennis]|nr:hypothetical protein J6590_021151 [Homalodisca vitripennis]
MTHSHIEQKSSPTNRERLETSQVDGTRGGTNNDDLVETRDRCIAGYRRRMGNELKRVREIKPGDFIRVRLLVTAPVRTCSYTLSRHHPRHLLPDTRKAVNGSDRHGLPPPGTVAPGLRSQATPWSTGRDPTTPTTPIYFYSDSPLFD